MPWEPDRILAPPTDGEHAVGVGFGVIPNADRMFDRATERPSDRATDGS